MTNKKPKININFRDTPTTTQKCVQCKQKLCVQEEPFSAKAGPHVLLVYNEVLYCNNVSCKNYHLSQIHCDNF